MFEVRSEAAKKPEVIRYYSHADAQESPYLAFRDELDDVYIITDEGCVDCDGWAYGEHHPEYPLAPLAEDEYLAIK